MNADILSAGKAKAAIRKFIEKQNLAEEERLLMEKILILYDDLERRVEEKTKELRSSNLNLISAVERLRQAEDYKSKFVSMVSHELRTPLTAILGFADTIIKKMDVLDKKKTHEYLIIIRQESLRLARLIEEILELSRYQNQAPEAQFRKVDLKAAVQEVLKNLEPTAKESRFELSFQESARDAFTDGEGLKQILSNLLSNAIKYSPTGSLIRISAQPKENDIEFSVMDLGPGIAKEERGKIFQAFYRTQDPVNIKSPGTGLGLSIAKAIVENLGGRIWVADPAGPGSVIRFTIPKEKSHNKINPESAQGLKKETL